METNLTPEEQTAEIRDEFMLEAEADRVEHLPSTLNHINALLDAYLDMWPELVER